MPHLARAFHKDREQIRRSGVTIRRGLVPLRRGIKKPKVNTAVRSRSPQRNRPRSEQLIFERQPLDLRAVIRRLLIAPHDTSNLTSLSPGPLRRAETEIVKRTADPIPKLHVVSLPLPRRIAIERKTFSVDFDLVEKNIHAITGHLHIHQAEAVEQGAVLDVGRRHLNDIAHAIERQFNFPAVALRTIVQAPRVHGSVGRPRLRLCRLILAFERCAAARKPTPRPILKEQPVIASVAIDSHHQRIRHPPAARLRVKPAEQNSAPAIGPGRGKFPARGKAIRQRDRSDCFGIPRGSGRPLNPTTDFPFAGTSRFLRGPVSKVLARHRRRIGDQAIPKSLPLRVNIERFDAQLLAGRFEPNENEPEHN